MLIWSSFDSYERSFPGVEALTAALASVVGPDVSGAGDLASLMQTLAACSGAGGQDMFALLAAAAGAAEAPVAEAVATGEPAAGDQQQQGEDPAVHTGAVQDDSAAAAAAAAAGATASQDAAAGSLPLFRG